MSPWGIDRRVAPAVRLGYKQLKEEQVEVVEAYISGRDVFAVLPTGFGKSLCFACLPFVLEEIGHEKPIVIVVTPLTAIMKDQVRTVLLELSS